MIERTIPYTHLLYVRKYSIFTNCDRLYIIGVNTKDIFHTIGEYFYRSKEPVNRIDYVICTQDKIDYWLSEGYKIYDFKDKYK